MTDQEATPENTTPAAGGGEGRLLAPVFCVSLMGLSLLMGSDGVSMETTRHDTQTGTRAGIKEAAGRREEH